MLRGNRKPALSINIDLANAKCIKECFVQKFVKKDENDSAESKTRSRSEENLVDAKLEVHVPCPSC